MVDANTVHDLYIEKPPPRAWSRMTGVGNSLKLLHNYRAIANGVVFLQPPLVFAQ